MESPIEQTFPTYYGHLAARIWGPPDGEPVLALHGWLDNAASFDRLAPLLPGLRLLAIDLPGHGLSSHRPPGPSAYPMVEWANELLDILPAIGWRSYSILGHSMGGAVGVLLAAMEPARLKRLVLLESLGPLTAEAKELPARLRQARAERLRLQLRLDDKLLPVYATRELAAEARRRAGDLTAEATEALLTRGLRPTEGGFTWRSDPRLRLPSGQRLTEAQTEALLREITCPVLLLRAESGLSIPPAVLQGRCACLRGLKVEIVPGHHHVHLDHPERVSPSINSFFQR